LLTRKTTYMASLGSETQVAGGVSIRSKQKRNTEECTITLDLALDVRACRLISTSVGNAVTAIRIPVAHIVEDRVGRYFSRQFGRIRNWEALPYFRVRSTRQQPVAFHLECGRRQTAMHTRSVSITPGTPAAISLTLLSKVVPNSKAALLSLDPDV